MRDVASFFSHKAPTLLGAESGVIDMFNRHQVLKAALLSIALCNIPTALADTAMQTTAIKAFGNLYSQVPPVSNSQAQVVYYRSQNSSALPGAAHVYVDREFHAALLPGGFTAFCVAPGVHSLGAYLKDAPGYSGKNSDAYTATLTGGNTYFLRATEDTTGKPLSVTRANAERDLAVIRQQVQAVSRASTVQACNYLPMPEAAPAAKPYKDYVLPGDVLFRFGKSGYGDISSTGNKAINALVTQLQNENVSLKQIDVIGHTDAIGSPSSNQALGLKRAQTVRRLLIDAGLPASAIRANSAGANDPVTQQCKGSRAELIACYAPDRRVVVRVDIRN